MSESRSGKKTRNISFRVTDEEYSQLERVAAQGGEDPNNWCRKIVVAASSEGHGLARHERLLYGEIARLRFLVGHGFKLLLRKEEATAEAWNNLISQAEQRGELIADELLSRRH